MPHLFGTVSAVACDRSYYGTLRGPLKTSGFRINFVYLKSVPHSSRSHALRGKYDRKRVRSKRVLSNGPHSLGSDTNQNRY